MPATLLPAALAFLEREGERTPDYSDTLLVAPHHHAAQAFRQALVATLPGRHLRPPVILTLADLAAEDARPDEDAEPESVRLAVLRDFLEKSGQVPEGTLWEAARDLLGLLDELDTRGAPESVWDHLGRGRNRYLDLEAGLAREVWKALARSGRPGAAALRGRRLLRRAGRADRPLYVLGRVVRSGVEEDFLATWRQRAPVIELPTPQDHPDRLALLQAAWRVPAAGPPLAQRAHSLAAGFPRSLLHGSVRLLAAPGLEAAARSAEAVLLDWLAEGRRQILLVALDRLMARRLRALLERRGILVQDETGWAFSTASASHALDATLRLVTGNAWFRDLLDFLHSPYVLADDPGLRERAAQQLDEAFRRHGAPDGLAGHQTLARQLGLDAAKAVLARLDDALTGFARGRRSLQEWTRRWLDLLGALAIRPALGADPVGRQLLSLLDRLAAESAGHRARYPLADWRRWLFLHLEEDTFLDDTVLSPLRLTHLGAAHTREVEGVILLGAGAAHLPPPPASGLFNDAARRQLGLPGALEKEEELRADLMDLLARAPRAVFVWQAEEQGEPVPLSPWLVHLDAFHQAAWGRPWLEPAPPADGPGADETPPALVPSPASPGVPARLSVSAWQSLVACPYQFHARHQLGLNERDEVQEEMEKADYGSLVHQVLAGFHAAYPRLADHDRSVLETQLAALTRETFAPAEAASYLALAWRLRWERQHGAYLDWAQAREQAGYAFQAGEQRVEREVTWPGGSTLLHGRVDRLEDKAGAVAVLDYKTQARDVLRKKLDEAAEDAQLTTYAWLTGAAEAGFVGVDDDKVDILARKGDLAAQAALEGERLAATLAGLAAGAPLPAQGAPQTCSWCEMRGLCRREHQA
ncbi:MAG: PD-(D/E)XK nuclease family protein [Pseudomonadota bacterium]